MKASIPPRQNAHAILIIEGVGFSFILFLSWGAAIFNLPHYLFGDADTFNWQRALLRTAIILPIWAWVHFTTKALIKRLRYLEEFMLICAWCRKVGHQDQWLTMEEYFGSKFSTATSHGICPDCAEHVIAKVEQQDGVKESSNS